VGGGDEMFRIDASILRECVEAVLAVVDEARLKIGEEAWKVWLIWS